jgi:hypothetical protein
VIGKILFQPLRQGSINFDGDHLAGAAGQQPGHGAPPWADFDHHIVGTEIKFLQNFVPIALIVEEMLAEFGAMATDFRFWILDFGFTLPSRSCIIPRWHIRPLLPADTFLRARIFPRPGSPQNRLAQCRPMPGNGRANCLWMA